MAKSVLSAATGIPETAIENTFGAMNQLLMQQQANLQYQDFTTACPDYIDSPDNFGKLAEYLPSEVWNAPEAKWVEGGRMPTSRELKAAYAQAVYDGKLARGGPPNAPTTDGRRLPPPTPASTAPAATAEVNPYTMPLAQLKKLLEQG